MKRNDTQSYNLDHIKTDALEYFETTSNEQRKQLIHIETSEWSSVCPYSGLPDYGILKIDYYPERGRIIETRSLKMYVISFRNVGMFQEHVAVRLYNDLEAIVGDNLRIELTYNVRGGYSETVTIGTLNHHAEP